MKTALAGAVAGSFVGYEQAIGQGDALPAVRQHTGELTKLTTALERRSAGRII